jgi:hypothetical protein
MSARMEPDGAGEVDGAGEGDGSAARGFEGVAAIGGGALRISFVPDASAASLALDPFATARGN